MNNQFNKELVLNNIPELNFDKKIKYHEEIYKYFDFYNLNFNNVDHYFGYFNSNKNKIVSHIFKPSKSKGVVFTLHGYFDHTGCLGKLITFLIDNNYTVVSLDFQGLGLSEGERTAIDDFNEYADSLKSLVELCNKNIVGPYNFICFSTGASVILEYLCNYKDDFNNIILVSPLIRSGWFKLSKLSYLLFHFFVKDLIRVFRIDTSDKEFIYFRKYEDPLQDRAASVKWVRALFKWNKTISKKLKLDRDIYILQGTDDETVDWKYNIAFFKKRISNVKVTMFKNCGHQLINEGRSKLELVFDKIKTILEFNS